jgi:hypothetical protein
MSVCGKNQPELKMSVDSTKLIWEDAKMPITIKGKDPFIREN